MNFNKTIVCCVFVLICLTVSAQQTLYVSSSGKDNYYSADKPGNPDGLNTKLKELRRQGSKHITVYLKGGTYLLDQSFVINDDVAGNKSDTLIFSGIEGEKVILSGGKKVTQWEMASNGMFKAQLPQGTNFRQLYINGKMAIRARTPNRENEYDFSPYYRGLRFDQNNKTILVNASEIAKWKNMQQIEMIFHQHWYQSRVKIESFKIEKDTAVVTALQPGRDFIFQLTYARMLNPDKPYYFENALEFLDQGGEWYLDTNDAVLYYKPRPNEDIRKIEVVYPVLDIVVRIKGKPDKPVQNVTLRNIEIAYNNWTVPSRDGIIATQAVQGRGYSYEPGIVHVDYARNIKVQNCNIFCAGAHGVVLGRGVQFSGIISCHIDQISANGIVIDTYKKPFPPDSLFCKDNRVANNLIENVGMQYTNGMGLLASCVARLMVENNEIRYSRYMGMQIGNHYGDNLSGMRDNIIRRNNIHHVMLLHDDGGAIYTLAAQPGTKILRNWMHDYEKAKWSDDFPTNGVFLDNNSRYIRVQDNVMTDLKNVDLIKEQHAGNATTPDNLLINNNTQDKEVIEESGPKGKVGVI